MGPIAFAFAWIGEGLTNLGTMIGIIVNDWQGFLIAPYANLWEYIKSIIPKITSKMKSMGSQMFKAIKDTFLTPFKTIWNRVAGVVPGMEGLTIGQEGSRQEAGLAKNDPVMSPQLPKPIPIPRREAGLDKALERFRGPIPSVTINQSVTATPGMDTERLAAQSAKQIEMSFQKEFAKTMANSPRTE